MALILNRRETPREFGFARAIPKPQPSMISQRPYPSLSRRRLPHRLAAVFISVALAGAALALADDTDVLINMLQKRGVLSNKDASEVRTEMAKQREKPVDADTAAAKLKLSDSISLMKIYGEVRLGYRINQGEAAGLDAGDSGQRDRLRYVFRLGSDIVLHDGWSAGFMLETNNNNRSGTVTLGENPFFSKATITKDSTFINGVTIANGPVVTGVDAATGKVTTGKAVTSVALKKGTVVSNINVGDQVFVGRVFLKYQPTDWLTAEIGKI
jgi:hypothetical protein